MRAPLVALFAVLVGGTAVAAAADLPPEEVIQNFAANETILSKVRELYTYRWSAKMDEFDADGRQRGRWQEIAEISFNPDNQRNEKVVFNPASTLRSGVPVTLQDLEDLRGNRAFPLTTDEIPKYDIHYNGKEKIDEINCYRFSVKPKARNEGERYFEGDVWVDDRDLQIVRSASIQAPGFEIYREYIDGYWFPSYAYAAEALPPRNTSARIQLDVRYSSYRRNRVAANGPDEKTKPFRP